VILLFLIMLSSILLVIIIGLVIGTYWEWQTARSQGNTSRGFPAYYISGEASGFSLKKKNTLKGLLARSTPCFFITPIIISINMLMYLLMVLSDFSMFIPKIDQLLSWGANFGPLTVNGQWWRLLSSTFLHAGPLHLIFNMWFLWKLGNYAERIYGNWTFLMIYILSGVGGGIISLLWHPKIVNIGASGAIFGVAGGLLTFVYRERLNLAQEIKKDDLVGILVFLGYNLIRGFGQSGIVNAAHIGGLFVGLFVTLVLRYPLSSLKVFLRPRNYYVFSKRAFGYILVLAGCFDNDKFSPTNSPISDRDLKQAIYQPSHF
jgi:membrane associated rhomboid family serine protease